MGAGRVSIMSGATGQMGAVMRRGLLAVVAMAGALLAGCTPAPGGPDLPPAGTASITISQGGPFNGGNSVTVYRTDVAHSVIYGPNGSDREERVTDLAPGTYDRLAAMLAKDGPDVLRRMKREPACPDYGSDAIRAEPPVGGFSAVVAGCPEDRVTALIQKAYAALVRP